MHVQLVAVTKPCLPGVETAEDLMVYCARVSNPDNQLNLDTGAKLLRYCAKNGHWSVFEQADMTVEIRTSRAVAAQLLRHRSFTFQEFSQRYAEVPDKYEHTRARGQDPKNRQSSTYLANSERAVAMWDDLQQNVWQTAYNSYRVALDAGVAKELARMVLPLSTTTTLYMKGSVRSWIHYLKARTDLSTQLEHRQVAAEIEIIFQRVFPVTYDAVFGDD